MTDASGQPPVGVNPAPAATVNFESDTVVMGQEYSDDLKECFAIFRAVNEKYAISQSVPRLKLPVLPSSLR